MNRGPRALGAPALLALAAGVVLPVLGLAQPPERPDDQRELVELVRSFAASEDKGVWIDQQGARLTPERIAALEELTIAAENDRALDFVHASSWLLTFAKLRDGDPISSLRHRLRAHEAEFHLATTAPAYEQARDGSLQTAALVTELGATDLAFRALSLAADASYFASLIEDLDLETRESWRRRTLDDLNRAAQLATVETHVSYLERFASLTGAVLTEALSTYGFGGDEEWRIASLRRLAEALDRALPVEFVYEDLPGKGPVQSWALAQQLAALNYQFGSSAVASARLHVAAESALAEGDVEHWTEIVFQRYQGERDSGGAASQLARMREQLRATFASLRERYASRAGRLWAASTADRVFADLLKDQLDAGAVAPAAAFAEMEKLKSRYLLDQLTVAFQPLASSAEVAQADQLERAILSFPDCRRVERSLRIQELLLVSRVPIGLLMDEGREAQAVRELEALYRAAEAGFQGTARIPELSQVQSALRADEILIEYFIPYHPLHPAMALWVLAITRDRAVLERVDLEGVFGETGSGFIGRMSIDNCPPVDASPLGDTIAELRIAIQSSNEAKALRYLRGLHILLIEPVIRSGLRLSDYRHLIVVPHGPLHYLPFAALRGEGDRFLIADVAITVSPSAAVWLARQRPAIPRPESVLALLAPEIDDPDLPSLPGAEREVDAIRQRFAAARAEVFTGTDAVESRLRELGPAAEVLHLSTHGDFPEREAIDFHRVLLAAAGGDDGRLEAREIQNLDLERTAVVLLAICNGGLYRTGPSDEPYGLVPAFLTAGADTVVSTLWPLEDEFGREFVTRLYDHLLAVGPAKALRQTAMFYIGEEDLLRRWAGFISVGPARGYEELEGTAP